MSLPINIKSLLWGRTIESGRIECKMGWNPERIVHTVCAFANDFENLGGGYIIIGVEDDDGRIGDVVGLTDQEIVEIDRSLLNVCSLIEPHYVPELSIETVGNAKVAVIWAVSDDRRPFKCPVSVGSGKKRDMEKAYYIRHGSHTVRATRDEEISLMELSRRISFDEMASKEGGIHDMKRNLVEEYLRNIRSTLADSNLPDMELYDMMRLLKGPPEDRKPINAALMMFSSTPETFFPYSRTEVVIIHDPAGRLMDESVFNGPVDLQITRAMEFIVSRVVVERVRKVPGKTEAMRYRNYPVEAIREVLVNALYHRSYEIPEPVKVYIYPDRIEITSLPGPEPGISDESIRNLSMKGKYYRNKRLGDFLKELHLTEGRNTGMRMIVESLQDNGSGLPVYETDPGRTYLSVTIPIHPDFLNDTRPAAGAIKPKGRRNEEEIKAGILDVLSREGCIPSSSIAAALGYKSITPSLRRCINDLMGEGLVEYLFPDRPNDSRQRICLKRIR